MEQSHRHLMLAFDMALFLPILNLQNYAA